MSPGLQEPSPSPGARLLSGCGQAVNENSCSESHSIKKLLNFYYFAPYLSLSGYKIRKVHLSGFHLMNNISSDLPGLDTMRHNYHEVLG